MKSPLKSQLSRIQGLCLPPLLRSQASVSALFSALTLGAMALARMIGCSGYIEEEHTDPGAACRVTQ